MVCKPARCPFHRYARNIDLLNFCAFSESRVAALYHAVPQSTSNLQNYFKLVLGQGSSSKENSMKNVALFDLRITHKLGRLNICVTAVSSLAVLMKQIQSVYQMRVLLLS